LKKKIFSIVLTLAMVVSVAPVMVAAADESAALTDESVTVVADECVQAEVGPAGECAAAAPADESIQAAFGPAGESAAYADESIAVTADESVQTEAAPAGECAAVADESIHTAFGPADESAAAADESAVVADESVAAAANAKASLADHGPEPYSVKLSRVAKKNPNYRAAVWTGKELQLTVMSIPRQGEIGLEMHGDTDQFIYIVEGSGTVQMGPARDKLNYSAPVTRGSGVFVPLGTWHNIVNGGCGDLKVFTVYAPPHHPHGTVHKTKAIADAQGD